MVVSAEVYAEELASQCRGGQDGGPGPIALRQKGVRAIEDIGRLGLAKAGLIAYVERGHDGGPYSAGRDCPVPAGPRRSAAVNDRRPRPRGARIFERVIDGENGVVPSKGTASPPLLSYLLRFLQRLECRDFRLVPGSAVLTAMESARHALL